MDCCPHTLYSRSDMSLLVITPLPNDMDSPPRVCGSILPLSDDSPLTIHLSPPKISNIREDPLRLPIHPGGRRSLGQQPHAARRRLRPNPRPLSLRPPPRPARRRRVLNRQRRDLRHLRLPPTALPQPCAHVLVHAQSWHGVQSDCRNVRSHAQTPGRACLPLL